MRKNGTLALPSTTGVLNRASHRLLVGDCIGPGTNKTVNMDHIAPLARSVRGSGGPLSYLGVLRANVFPPVAHLIRAIVDRINWNCLT